MIRPLLLLLATTTLSLFSANCDKEPKVMYDPFAPGPLTDAVLAAYPGEAVLVVGHSNTIPALLNVLTGTDDFAQIPESQYDNLFIVSIFEKGRAPGQTHQNSTRPRRGRMLVEY